LARRQCFGGPSTRRSAPTSSIRSISAAGKAITLNAGRRLELIAQVFNVLNRKNLVAAWTTNALSPAFGTSVSASNMRQAEIAVRFTY
jgi:hypothetical protein